MSISIDPGDPANEALWLRAIEEVLAEKKMENKLLNDVKELWRSARASHPYNPIVRQLRELIRRHDPNWDDGTQLAHKFDISFPGAMQSRSTDGK